MKILLLSEVCPPSTYVGAFRVGKVASALASEGHSVHIIHSVGGPVDEGAHSGITSSQVTMWHTPREILLAVRAWVRERGPRTTARPVSLDNVNPTEVSVSKSRIRRAGIALLNVPDDRQGFIPAAVAAALRNRRDGYELIYSTAPSFSAHIAALILRRILHIPWIAEFRDPWSQNGVSSPKDESGLARRVDAALERICLTAADRVVAVSPGLAAEFQARENGRYRDKVTLALNGIDQISADRRKTDSDFLRVVYAGALYPPRDPAVLVEALLRAWNSSRITRPIEFTFVGKVDFNDEPRLGKVLSELPAGCSAKSLPWMDKASADDIIRGADLLILPAQRLLMQIPNKLYDYLGSRVPIFVAAERESDVSYLLENAGGHFVCYADMEQAEREAVAHRALLAAAKRPVSGDVEFLMSLKTEAQMSALVKSLLPSNPRDPGVRK